MVDIEIMDSDEGDLKVEKRIKEIILDAIYHAELEFDVHITMKSSPEVFPEVVQACPKKDRLHTL